LVAVLVAGLSLSATVVPAVFTIDEDNYLVTVLGLREGRLTVPGTEGLPPSSALLYFDPGGAFRTVSSTPVASTAPPLYAPLALPFAPLGWRGLVALQTLSFLAAALIVFAYARRHATAPSTPWLAVAAFSLGGYSIEYAQGLWPHMSALALTTGAVFLTAKLRAPRGEAGDPSESATGPVADSLMLAFAAGILAGLATGLRYQNILFAGCVGLGILLLTPRRRMLLSATYAAGVAVPLAAASLLNHLRLGSWNPISKGPGYLSFTERPRLHGFVGDTLLMAWARVVDYGTRPPLLSSDHAGYMLRDPEAGAWLIGTAVKKAWLQSAPWIVLALAVCAGAWFVALRRRRQVAPAATGADRELRAIALILFPVIAMFSAAGVSRTDGLGFNQRYLLELVPLAAVAFAWSLDGVRIERSWVLAGVLGGMTLTGLALLQAPGETARSTMLLRVPLALAGFLLVGWTFQRLRPAAAGGRWLSLLAGAALGWSLTVHLGDDLRASRALRARNLFLFNAYERALPPPTTPAALVTWWGMKDAAGPLQIDRDLVILDAGNDGGENLPAMVDALQAEGRRVLLVATGFPRPVLSAVFTDRLAVPRSDGPPMVFEVLEPGERPP
jgi:hypothetical protein